MNDDGCVVEEREAQRYKRKIAYEKALIWGLFLGALYILRHFFFIIFLTFLISYMMRNLVMAILRRIRPRGASRGLERLTTLVCFIALLYSAYGIGRYIVPELVEQGHELVRKVSAGDKNPRGRVDVFVRDVVGTFLFQQRYGSAGDPAYEEAIATSRQFDPYLTPQQFELRERSKLAKDWQSGPVAQKIEDQLEEYVSYGLKSAGAQIGAFLPKLVLFPFQLGLILLLSFFITMDIPRMRAGLRRLKESRVGDVYDEIVPGLASFGMLIGRSFQAQAVIALANTVLTFSMIKFLGIQNAVFLAAIVFICSFIPVLGVVFSGFPIAVMAITQEGGGVMLAVWSVVGILGVHFIETSILNPKIIGEMLHLHPVLVLAILAIGEHFFGVWGLLLGVPVAVYIIRFVILAEGIPGLIPMPTREPRVREPRV